MLMGQCDLRTPTNAEFSFLRVVSRHALTALWKSGFGNGERNFLAEKTAAAETNRAEVYGRERPSQ
jgi:hypothetical protein